MASVSAALDKTHYEPGETMTLTVDYTVPAESRVTAHAVLEFLGASAQSADVEAKIYRLSVVDNGARDWLLEEDDGATARLTATA